MHVGSAWDAGSDSAKQTEYRHCPEEETCMNNIKEMIVSAAAGVLFIVAVTVLVLVWSGKQNLMEAVYRQSRFERILPE